jgi:hypothetical protein
LHRSCEAALKEDAYSKPELVKRFTAWYDCSIDSFYYFSPGVRGTCANPEPVLGKERATTLPNDLTLH